MHGQRLIYKCRLTAKYLMSHYATQLVHCGREEATHKRIIFSPNKTANLAWLPWKREGLMINYSLEHLPLKPLRLQGDISWISKLPCQASKPLGYDLRKVRQEMPAPLFARHLMRVLIHKAAQTILLQRIVKRAFHQHSSH